MQLGLHVKCAVFLSNFNQIWIIQQIFLKVTNTKLQQKSIQWQQRRCMQVDGHDKANRSFSHLCKCA